jgi:hypothetical protein
VAAFAHRHCEEEESMARLRALAERVFPAPRPGTTILHGPEELGEHLHADEVRHKKQFHVLRPLLARAGFATCPACRRCALPSWQRTLDATADAA